MFQDAGRLTEEYEDRQSLDGRYQRALQGRPKMGGISIDDAATGNYDDAILIERHGNDGGWTAHISIADAAAMVLPGSPLDAQAREHNHRRSRGEPGLHMMLPQNVVQNYLSLRKHTRRPAVTFTVHVAEDGTIKDYEITRTAFTAMRNCSGAEVGAAYRGGNQSVREWLALAEALSTARSAATMDHVPPPENVYMPAPHIPPRIYGSDCGIGNFLVQEMMLLAGFVAGDYMRKHNLPFLSEQLAATTAPIAGQGTDAFFERQENKVEQIAATITAADFSHRAKITSPNRCYRDLVNMQVLTAHLAGEAAPYSAKEITRIAANALHIRPQFNAAAKGLPNDPAARAKKVLTDKSGDYDSLLARLTHDEMLDLLEIAIAEGYQSKALRSAALMMLAGPEADGKLLYTMLVQKKPDSVYWQDMAEAVIAQIEDKPELGWMLADYLADQHGDEWLFAWQEENIDNRLRMTMQARIGQAWYEPHKVKTDYDPRIAQEKGMVCFWRAWQRGSLRPCEEDAVAAHTAGNDNHQADDETIREIAPAPQSRKGNKSKQRRHKVNEAPGFSTLQDNLRMAGWNPAQYYIAKIMQPHHSFYVAALNVTAPDGEYEYELSTGATTAQDALGRAARAMTQKLAQDKPRQFSTRSSRDGRALKP